MNATTFYLIIFLAGGSVSAYILYRIIKGLGIFHTQGGYMPTYIPRVTSPQVPVVASTQKSPSNSILTNLLLVLTICLASYHFIDNIDVTALESKVQAKAKVVTTNLPPVNKEATKTSIVSEQEIFTTKTREVYLNRQPFIQAISSPKVEYYLQITASKKWIAVQEKARMYQLHYPVKIGIGLGDYPYKVLIGPFLSEESIHLFQEQYPYFKDKWIRVAGDYEWLELVAP